MPVKTIKARIPNKIDTFSNWEKATNFIPLAGEIIVYSDGNGSDVTTPMFKMGDGIHNPHDLPFQNLTGPQGPIGPQGPVGSQGLQGVQGPQGETPVISANATVDNSVGTPSVEVQKSGTDVAPVFTFNFSNLKGEKGDSGDSGSKMYAHYLYITLKESLNYNGFVRALIVSPLQEAATSGSALINLLSSVGATSSDDKAVPATGIMNNKTVCGVRKGDSANMIKLLGEDANNDINVAQQYMDVVDTVV